MKSAPTTKISSKGQVVIPEEIRQRLGLHTGDRFVVVGRKDTIVLKTITAPSMEQFDVLIKQARKQARQAGLKGSDIKIAVKKSRRVK